MSKIKLLILDVDGVLTDGRKYYGLDGLPFAKTFCDKDFTAIKRLKALNISVIFLTGDSKVNEKLAENRNIQVYLSRGIDKASFLEHFEETYSCSRKDMCYVGDDLFDISIMKEVGYAFCPKNSPNLVKQHATTLDVCSGNDVVCYLFDYFEMHNLVEVVSFDEIMKKITALDAKEIF